MKYIFDEPLKEALIIKRTNRFLFEVLIDGEVEICHCPATGRIGNIVFNNIPCLISESKNADKRKTKHTVEAISLNGLNEKNKKWIGVNQNRANRFIEFFIKNNQLKNMIQYKGNLLREQTIDNSKLDFLVGNTYIEVKTPLVILPLKKDYITNKNLEIKEKTKFNSFDRFIKHINELAITLKDHEKAIMINFYMFEADRFIAPKVDNLNHPILKAVNNAIKNGVETWQINSKFDSEGIEIKDYYINNFK